MSWRMERKKTGEQRKTTAATAALVVVAVETNWRDEI